MKQLKIVILTTIVLLIFLHKYHYIIYKLYIMNLLIKKLVEGYFD